jgi:hypothetical protein
MTDLPLHRRLLLAAALAGPTAIVVGHALTVDASQKAAPYVAALALHRATGVTGGLLTVVGAFLLVPALLGIRRLAPGRGSGLAQTGSVLAGIGALGLGVGVAMITLVMGALVKADPVLAERVFVIATSSPLTSVPFLLAPCLFVGSLLLAIGLWRAGTVSKAFSALLVVGTVGIGAFSSGGGVAAALAHTPYAVAVIGLGVLAARSDTAGHPRPVVPPEFHGMPVGSAEIEQVGGTPAGQR